MLTIMKIQILLSINYFKKKKSKKITSGAFSYTSDNNKAWGN